MKKCKVQLSFYFKLDVIDLNKLKQKKKFFESAYLQGVTHVFLPIRLFETKWKPFADVMVCQATAKSRPALEDLVISR